jgi:CheY-like chemotaxis protein
VTERTPKILVVDDVPENVRLLEAVLASHGYEVVTANDGRAALERVQTAEPDVILRSFVFAFGAARDVRRGWEVLCNDAAWSQVVGTHRGLT